MKTELFLKELLRQVVTLWLVRIDPQKTEGQGTEGGGRRTEDRVQRTEFRGQSSEDRVQRTGVGKRQRSEDRGQKSEVD